MKKRVLSAMLVAVLLSGLCFKYVHGTDYSVLATSDEYNFTDRNRMSDEDFFGKWSVSEQKWEKEPKINYSYNTVLLEVSNLIKRGRYSEGKRKLMDYYKNRNISMSEPSARSSLEAKISLNNIHTFESPAAGIISVGKKKSSYSVDVTNLVKSNVSCFLLHSLKREKDAVVSFDSKECGSNMPILEVKQGSTVTNLAVSQDMYIRGGSYSGTNYGASTVVAISETGNAPGDSGTRQGHIKFDLSSLDRSKVITKAILKLYGSSTTENKEVVIFSGVESSWEEDKITYSGLPIRVASWNNVPDAYSWERISGLHTQFYNVQIRLNHIPRLFAEYFATKDKAYAVAAINQTLDFIGDNGGLIYDTYTKEAALNAAFRGNPQLPYIFAGILGADGITDENVFASVLKLIYQEASGLTYPENEWRKHNGQAFQINSLLKYTAYFPEFTDRDKWVSAINRRFMELSEDLLFEDGGYLEATSGYDAGVLNTFTELFSLAKLAEINIPDEFVDIYEKFALAEMNLTMPNGTQWGWGDGGPSADMHKRILAAAELTGNEYMYHFATANSAEIKGTVPYWTSYYLPISKLGVMRSGWEKDAVAAFFRGRTGETHSHADVNQMLMYAYGRYLLADTGMNSYDSRDPYYKWQKSRSESHNTIEVNNAGQPKSGECITNMYTNPYVDFYSCESHAYPKFTHTRKVSFPKIDKFFIVSDFVEAPADGTTNLFNQTWHNLVEANPSINSANKIAKTNYSSGANVAIVPVNKDLLSSASLDAGVGLNESNNVRNTSEKKHVSYKIKTKGNAVFNTIIYPFRGTANDTIVTKTIEVKDNADKSAQAFSATLPDSSSIKYYVSFGAEKIRKFDVFETDAGNMMLKYNSSAGIEAFYASQINSLKNDGREFFKSSKRLTDLSARYEADTININTTDNFDSENDYIFIYAPCAETVYLNDREISFYRYGECIAVGKYDGALKDKEIEKVFEGISLNEIYSDDFELPKKTIDNFPITWRSYNTEFVIVSGYNAYVLPKEDVGEALLTAFVTNENGTISKDFKVKVKSFEYSGEYILNEDFELESGEMLDSSVWKLDASAMPDSNGTYSGKNYMGIVSENDSNNVYSIKRTDNSVNGSLKSYIHLNLSNLPVGRRIIYETSVKCVSQPKNVSGADIYINHWWCRDNGNTIGRYSGFAAAYVGGNNGIQIKSTLDTAPTSVAIPTQEKNWYTLKFDVNPEVSEFDAYVDGEKKAESFAMRASGVPLKRLSFGFDGNTTGELWIDNIKVYEFPHKIEEFLDDEALGIENPDDVYENIKLPVVNDMDIKWISSNPEILSNEGVINPYAVGDEFASVSLFAVLNHSGFKTAKEYKLNIAGISCVDPSEGVDIDISGICTEDYILDMGIKNIDGVNISWSSGNKAVVTDDGKVIRPFEDTVVDIKAVFTKRNVSVTKEYTILVPAFCAEDKIITYPDALCTVRNGVAVADWKRRIILDPPYDLTNDRHGYMVFSVDVNPYNGKSTTYLLRLTRAADGDDSESFEIHAIPYNLIKYIDNTLTYTETKNRGEYGETLYSVNNILAMPLILKSTTGYVDITDYVNNLIKTNAVPIENGKIKIAFKLDNCSGKAIIIEGSSASDESIRAAVICERDYSESNLSIRNVYSENKVDTDINIFNNTTEEDRTIYIAVYKNGKIQRVISTDVSDKYQGAINHKLQTKLNSDESVRVFYWNRNMMPAG